MYNENNKIWFDFRCTSRPKNSAIYVLKSLGAEKILANGDIGERQSSLQESQDYVATILDALGKSDLETFFHTGSHESIACFEPVADYFSDKYPNIHNTLKIPKVEQEGHELVFLPGSDFVCGGEYLIGDDEQIPSGRYVHSKEGLKPFIDWEAYNQMIETGEVEGVLNYTNMNDLRKLVTNPDKTVVVCHVPRKFDNVGEAVDMAYFAEKSDGSVMPGVMVENMIRKQMGDVPYEIIQQVASNNGLTLKKENRGNEYLRRLYEVLGIRKSVTGHFHESGHRANDRNGNHVQEGQFLDELFWNSGHLDVGQTGILTVKDEKVSYQNIRLENHIKQ